MRKAQFYIDTRMVEQVMGGANPNGHFYKSAEALFTNIPAAKSCQAMVIIKSCELEALLHKLKTINGISRTK